MTTKHMGSILLAAALGCAVAFAEPDQAFVSFANSVKAFSGGFLAGNRAKIVIGDQACVDVASQEGRGLNVIAFQNGEIVLAERYDTYDDATASKRFYDAVVDLPKGCYVVIAACDEPASAFTEDAATAIRRLGGKYSLVGKYRWSYLLIGQKGLMPGDAIEKIGPSNLTHNVSAEAVLAEPVPTE